MYRVIQNYVDKFDILFQIKYIVSVTKKLSNESINIKVFSSTLQSFNMGLTSNPAHVYAVIKFMPHYLQRIFRSGR
jgi:hypothetical protein